ncbi:phosphorylase [Leptolyngbya sp. FACHB-261]|uniref:phosphorylase family protein n=1 Tax=Leptolyngbya sp. FACHB-261 TaxID=2692806 RepID=UPI001688D128|nr:phosphorylase [Leptolyngbya sp. FACHB-261]MBD2104902.1 phosphorylase [Leptolyngbya sp. FACHB-261]
MPVESDLPIPVRLNASGPLTGPSALISGIDAVLVPQGAEYQAVVRALPPNGPLVVPLAIGPAQAQALALSLKERHWRRVLITGVCGSLAPNYGIGTVGVYEGSVNGTDSELCDPTLTSALLTALPEAVAVRGLTTERVLCQVAEKRSAQQTSGAQVVDMESYPLLQELSAAGVAVAVLRVVSDDCQHDLPDLNTAIDAQGQLQPLALAWQLLCQPLAGYQLVRGSLRSLRVLQQTLRCLFPAQPQ